MKILAVRGRNLASLAGDFSVDLDAAPLDRAGLFVITGPTGAGKSTILDALCLALYDRIPRLDGSRQGVLIGQERSNDPRTLLRRGASEAMAEVDFVGVDRQRYRAHWTVRRARNHAAGRLQAQQMTLHHLDTDAETLLGRTKTEVLTKTEEVLGLSYEQFRRSALLAQGDFAAFLRASGNERSELLERMTGTMVYSRVSVLAHERAQRESIEWELLRRQMDELRVLDSAERIRLEVEADTLLQKLKVLRAALLWSKRLQELTDLEQEACRQLECWHEEWKAFERMERVQPLKSDWDAFVELRRKVAASQKKREVLQIKQRELAKAKAACAKEAQEAVDFASLRKDLRDGEACPLCGSLHHPWRDRTAPAQERRRGGGGGGAGVLAKKKYEEIKLSLKLIESQLEMEGKQIEELYASLRTVEGRLLKSEMTLEELQDIFSAGEGEEKKRMEALREQGSRLKGRLEYCQEQKKKHEEEEVDGEAPSSQKLEKDLAIFEGAFHVIQAKLNHNRKAQEGQNALREKARLQRKRADLWESMRSLIGSSDGNKFRRFAQSLTLDTLVAYANEHLKEIAPRYALQRVPQADLDLQIIDRDMGDEVRSANSLSGGESFLVSLALALGLASLSSNQTQVESLFIDEGFGSLDSYSLDVAIDALDSLQALGRQVGVISHIPTLIERIGTCVTVVPKGGGRSEVVIA